MRRLQKILLGTFLGGVLLTGIGAGVAFVEYSSITYAGEKKIGQESMVTKNFDFFFDAEKGIVKVLPVWYDDGKVSYVELDPSVPEDMIRYQVTYNEKILTPFLSYHEYDEPEEETEFTDENEGPGRRETKPGHEDADDGVSDGEADADLEDGDAGNEDADWENGAAGNEAADQEANAGQDGLAAGKADAVGEGPDASVRNDGRANVIEASDPGKKKVIYQGELSLRNNYRDDFGLWMASKDEILQDLKQGRIASYRTDNVTEVKILVNPASADHIKQLKEH